MIENDENLFKTDLKKKRFFFKTNRKQNNLKAKENSTICKFSRYPTFFSFSKVAVLFLHI